MPDGDTLYGQILSEVDGHVVEMTTIDGVVVITLAADAEAVAQQLSDRYGDAVDITVGALRYPIEEAISQCRDVPAQRGIAPELTVEIEPPLEPLDASGVVPASLIVTLTNERDDPIRFNTGSASRRDHR